MSHNEERIGSMPSPPKIECPNCGSESVETRKDIERFSYGTEGNAVELTAVVPVRRCHNCSFEFTDWVAEDLRHEAVCRHLGVMTPNEIIALRKRYEMSRHDFAQLTRLGEASLARWETGQLIQNPANDQLLFLLTVPSNVELLKRRASRTKTIKLGANAQMEILNRFPAIHNIELSVAQAASFRLCESYHPLT